MADTDKIKAGLSKPVAFSIPMWAAGVLLSAVISCGIGLTAWLHNAATKQEVMIEQQGAGVQATRELKAEVKELRQELSTDNRHIRNELNALRERVAALEAKVK